MKFVTTTAGFDPYNTVDATLQAKVFVATFNGPLNPVAYRSQQNWDFLPGLSAAEKIKYWGVR